MADIRVEPVVLDALGEELAGVAAALGGQAAALGRSGAVASGEPVLVAALEELARSWEAGLARLVQEASATADAVRAAGAVYRQVEAAVGQACR